MRIHPIQLAVSLAMALIAVAAHASAMTFEKITGPTECASRVCVLASGDIDKGTAEQFDAFLKAAKIEAGALVVLDSLGGELMPGLAMGNAIRKAGLSTTVQSFDPATRQFKSGGRCASACAYVFIGGVQRAVGLGAKIGVHQPASGSQQWAMSAQDGMWLMSMVAVHVNRLCGNLDLMIPALRTPPAEVYWLSSVELSRFDVVTAPSVNG